MQNLELIQAIAADLIGLPAYNRRAYNIRRIPAVLKKLLPVLILKINSSSFKTMKSFKGADLTLS